MDSQEEYKYHEAPQDTTKGNSGEPTVIIRKNGLTFSRLVMLTVCLMIVIVISGCGVNGTVNAQTPGLFNHYLVYPFSWLIGNFAGWLDGSYGLRINCDHAAGSHCAAAVHDAPVQVSACDENEDEQHAARN